MYTYTDSGKAFQHIHSGVPLFTILSGGNVGIGLTSPSQKLEVAGFVMAGTTYRTSIGASGSGAYIYFGDTSNLYSIGRIGGYNSLFNISSFNGPISFQISDSEKVRINSNGNLGIGTTNPINKFAVISSNTTGYYNRTDPVAIFQGVSPSTVLISVDGNVNGYYAELKLGNAQSTYYPYSAYIRGIQGSGIDYYRLEFGTANGSAATTKMTIATDGNIGIGTASPSSKLHIDDVNAPWITISRSGTPTWQLRNNYPNNQYGFRERLHGNCVTTIQIINMDLALIILQLELFHYL